MAYSILVAFLCFGLAVWIQSVDGPALGSVLSVVFTAYFALAGVVILLDSWTASEELGETDED